MLEFKENFITRLINSNRPNQHSLSLLPFFLANFTGASYTYPRCLNTGVFQIFKSEARSIMFWSFGLCGDTVAPNLILWVSAEYLSIGSSKRMIINPLVRCLHRKAVTRFTGLVGMTKVNVLFCSEVNYN